MCHLVSTGGMQAGSEQRVANEGFDLWGEIDPKKTP